LIDKNGLIKIADFGLSRAFEVPMCCYTREVSTLWYRAPELLITTTIEKYSPLIDVWSIGCIFAELLLKKPLFMGDSDIDQLYKIARTLGTPPLQKYSFLPKFSAQNLSFYFKLESIGMELLLKMLEMVPEKRISSAKALQHDFFAKTRVNILTNSHTIN